MTYHYKSVPVDIGINLFRVFMNDTLLSHREVHQLWQEDPKFSQFYSQALAEAGHSGFCWETPPVTNLTLDKAHEFVVIKSDSHARISEDWTPFTEHFRAGELAVAFLNLGKNGTMIAPNPDSSFDGSSIASFLNTASPDRIYALWSLIGLKISQQLHDRPIWLSTAGLGVSWLHVRLDSRPKYYRYKPYKSTI